MRLPPLSPFVPPVTGTGGLAASVTANLFDFSGQFRNRLPSGTKRLRPDNWGSREEEDLHARFDLTRSFPPLVVPPPPKIDLPAIKSLMVEAAKSAAETKNLLAGKNTSAPNKLLAGSVMALYGVVEALLEQALFPLVEHYRTPPAATQVATPPPADPAETRELREALERADKTSIIFGANLGEAAIANRGALAHNLNVGIRNSTISRAGADVAVAAESVRVVSDAMSLVKNAEFLGGSSKIHSTRDGKLSGFYSMPVKVEFENKGARIHFERTLREKCDIRPSISLPTGIRNAQAAFHNELKQKYEGYIIMTRPDTPSLSFIAFAKKDGEKGWTKLDDVRPIDPAAVRDNRNDNANRRIVPTSHVPQGQATGGAAARGDNMDQEGC